MWRKRIVAACAFSLISNVQAQSANCADQAIVVNVRDKQGGSVSSLRPEDFRARLDKKVVPFLSVAAAAGAPRLVILLDKSASMDGEVKAKVLRFVAHRLVESSPPSTQVAMIAFATKVQQVGEFGRPRSEVLSAIDRAIDTPAEGHTALRDALLRASDLLGTTQLGDAVVVLSDGVDVGSKISVANLQRIYWSKRIRVFLFELRDPYLTTLEEEQGEEESEALATGTGGLLRKIARPDRTQILTATRQIEDELSNYLIAHVEGPESGGKAESLELEILDQSGRRRKDVELSFPHKLMPCDTTESTK